MIRYLLPLLPLFLLVTFSCGKEGEIPEGSGFVEATEVVVSAEVTGQIRELNLSEGERVKAGDIICQIDTTALALRLKEALSRRRIVEARIQSARLDIERALLDSALAAIDFKRISNLSEKGSATPQQYDRAETRYRQKSVAVKLARSALKIAQAELNQVDAQMALIRKNLDDCRPRAPLTGTVIITYLKAGELVTAGRPLVRIASLDTVWVKIYVPPRYLSGIKLRQQAVVDPEDGGEPLKGWVSWISDQAEFTPKNVETKQARADLVYAVKVTIPNVDHRLKIGMPVMVRLP